MSNEEDPKHVVDLTLIPVGTVVEASNRRYRLGLVGIGLNAYPRVVANAQKVIDDLESLITGREIDSRDIRNRGEFGRSVVPERPLALTSVSEAGAIFEATLPPAGRVRLRSTHLRKVMTGITPEGGI